MHSPRARLKKLPFSKQNSENISQPQEDGSWYAITSKNVYVGVLRTSIFSTFSNENPKIIRNTVGL